MSTRLIATTKAPSSEAKTTQAGPTLTTDADPAFTLGASVLVGGVKPGRLRYIGGVHFVAGQWCGIELDDADGLHDGVVDGTRYFTCREGHGIFAPRHRVTVRTYGRSPGSPDVRMRTLRKPSAGLSSSSDDSDVERFLRHASGSGGGGGSSRHRQQASLDSRDLVALTSTAKSSSARPQSAVTTEDELTTRKRSSLVTGRVMVSNSPRASPKRVTFLDEIVSSKERGVPSSRIDRRPQDDDDRDLVVSSVDPRTAMTLAYGFDEGSPSRKTSRVDPGNTKATWSNEVATADAADHRIRRVYMDTDLDTTDLDLEIANVLTPDQELSLSSDSIEAKEIDEDFASYGLTSITQIRLGDELRYCRTSAAPASKSPKTRVEAALSDLELMAVRQKDTTPPVYGEVDISGRREKQGAYGTSDGVQSKSSTSAAASASFELARTALSQYADLVRAAQESQAVRRSWTPPAVRRTLPTPTAAEVDHHNFESAPKELDNRPSTDDRVGRSPEPVAVDGGSGSCIADEVDFETFDGEELDSIGDAMIDSIDGSSVQSEDSIAMLPHLSDVDDDDDADVVGTVHTVEAPTEDRLPAIDDPVAVSDVLTSSVRDRDNGNDVDGNTWTDSVNNSNDVVDINLLNEFNNVVSCRQMARDQPSITQKLDRTEDSRAVGITGSPVVSAGGFVDDIDYFLHQSTAMRDERPMSLISNSSSTDTGCVLDADSDVMFSSALMMSSAGGSDDVMDESWQQQQQQQDDADEGDQATHASDAETQSHMPQAVDHCPLDPVKAPGEERKDADVSKKDNENTDRSTTHDHATDCRSSVDDSSQHNMFASDSDSLSQGTSVVDKPAKINDKEMIEACEVKEDIQVPATLKDRNEQKLVDEEDLGLLQVHVPRSAEAETCLSTVCAGKANDDSQQASKPVANETPAIGIVTDDVNSSCQLSQLQSVELSGKTDANDKQSETDLQDVSGAKQTAITQIDSGKTTKTFGAGKRTPTKIDATKQTKQRLQSNPGNVSSKEKPDPASENRLDETGGNPSGTNPRSTSDVSSTTSQERKSRGSPAVNVQRAVKNTPALGEMRNGKTGNDNTAMDKKKEATKTQLDVETRSSLKSASTTQKLQVKAPTAASSRSTRRDAAERPWRQASKPKNGAGTTADVQTKEDAPVGTIDKNSRPAPTNETGTIVEKKNEPENADDQQKTGTDKVIDDSTAANHTESTVRIKLHSTAGNPGKGATSSAKKPSATKSNPRSDDADKNPGPARGETQTTTGKQRTKLTGQNPVSRPASNPKPSTDQPADKSPKGSSNPGNPRTEGSRSTSSGNPSQGESKDSIVPAKKPVSLQQPRSSAGRAALAKTDKPAASGFASRTSGQPSKTTQHASEKSGETSVGDSKERNPRVGGKSATEVDTSDESQPTQARRQTVDSSKAKPAATAASTAATGGRQKRATASTSKPTSTTTASTTKRPARKPASLSDQLAESKEQLSAALQQTEQVNSEKELLQKSLDTLREERTIDNDKLKEELKQQLQTAVEEHEAKLQAEISRVIDQHSHEVKTLRQYHERQMTEMKREFDESAKASQDEHSATVARLEATHSATITALKTEHEWQLNEITERFESIKHSLSDTVEQLRSRCDELSTREQIHAASCQKHTDVRQQMALEVNSLQVVLDQKNDDIRRLRQRQSELEFKLEEIPTLKAQISKHQQQTENLEAIVNIKTDHERQLTEMHQHLLKKFERESKAMKRLSMNNEELMWKLSQSDYGPLSPDDDDSALSESASGGGLGVAMPSRGRGSASSRAMSRSYDSPRAMFGPSGAGARHRGGKTSSDDTQKSKSSTSTASDSAAGGLRRSGTYEVVDDE